MNNTIDMTRGRPLPLLARFALPLLLTSLLQQLYFLCDSVIVGRLLGLEAFAAIGAAAFLIMLPQDMLLGLSHGFGAVLAQLFGAGDTEGFRRARRITAQVSLGGALSLSLLMIFLREPLLSLIHTPAELAGLSASYLQIIYAGLTADAMFNWAAAVLRAAGDSRTPLVALLVSSIANIALDLLLVLVFPLGVQGAAIATVSAQLLALAICAFSIMTKRMEYPPRTDTHVDGSLKRLLHMGVPPLLRNGVAAVGCLFVQNTINTFGVTLVAGMTAASRYFAIMNMCGGAIEGASATFIAQNAGAGLQDRIKAGTRLSTLLALLFSGLTMIAAFFLAPALIRLITGNGDAEALRMGVYALRCTALFLPALYILCLYRAILQGLGDSVTPMLSGFTELAMRVFCVLLLPSALGYTAACIADGIGWLCSALLLVVRYLVLRRHQGHTIAANH